MSITLGISKGKEYAGSEFIDDVPVSFFSVWKRTWERAQKECNIRIFMDCQYFRISEVPQVLEELDRIYEWVQTNGGEDTEYVSWRIRDQLKPFLMQFYEEHKDEDYWFDIG